MCIVVLTATYELRVSRKSHLRDHPMIQAEKKFSASLFWPTTFNTYYNLQKAFQNEKLFFMLGSNEI